MSLKEFYKTIKRMGCAAKYVEFNGIFPIIRQAVYVWGNAAPAIALAHENGFIVDTEGKRFIVY
ncbi:MAG: hypothetical protein J6W84_03530 [Bacteroidales bacterium]|nr:hypothetical protein [Bacteroidales bacterium]